MRARRIEGAEVDSNWEFLGGKASRFRQIGNAVPPGLSECIARSLANALGEMDTKSQPPASAALPSDFRRAITSTISEHRVNGESRQNRNRARLRDR
jgi:hypothetical protein